MEQVKNVCKSIIRYVELLNAVLLRKDKLLPLLVVALLTLFFPLPVVGVIVFLSITKVVTWIPITKKEKNETEGRQVLEEDVDHDEESNEEQ